MGVITECHGTFEVTDPQKSADKEKPDWKTRLETFSNEISKEQESWVVDQYGNLAHSGKEKDAEELQELQKLWHIVARANKAGLEIQGTILVIYPDWYAVEKITIEDSTIRRSKGRWLDGIVIEKQPDRKPNSVRSETGEIPES